MKKAVTTTLRLIPSGSRFNYFALTITRAISGILDVLGIAGVGLVAAAASGEVISHFDFQFFGFRIDLENKHSLLFISVLILLLFIVKALLSIFLSRKLSLLIGEIEFTFGSKVFKSLMTGPQERLKTFSKGEILWAAIASSEASAQILMSLASIFAEIVLLILISVTLFVFDPMAAISVICYLAVVVVLLQIGLAKSQKQAGKVAAEAYVDSASAIEDFLRTFREITVYGETFRFLNKFDIARQKLATSGANFYFLGLIPRYVIETSLMLGVMLFVGWQFFSGNIENGIATIGVFLTGGVRAMASFLPLQTGVANIKRYSEQSKLAQQILSEPENLTFSKQLGQATEDSNRISQSEPVSVSVSNVTKTYTGNELPTLEGVSLEIAKGENIAIIGSSGAGKSTLVDLILGFIEPEVGNVFINGSQARNVIFENPGLISYLPQKPGLVEGSLLENITLGSNAKNIDRKRLNYAIKGAHLGEFIDSLPKGVDTILTGQLETISGGQAQRLGLARALYRNPGLLILDEATSALDARTESVISETIRSLKGQVTIVTIAHRLSTIQDADRVILLESGKIIAEGTFDFLVRNNSVVSEYARLMQINSSGKKE